MLEQLFFRSIVYESGNEAMIDQYDQSELADDKEANSDSLKRTDAAPVTFTTQKACKYIPNWVIIVIVVRN